MAKGLVKNEDVTSNKLVEDALSGLVVDLKQSFSSDEHSVENKGDVESSLGY